MWAEQTTIHSEHVAKDDNGKVAKIETSPVYSSVPNAFRRGQFRKLGLMDELWRNT